MNKVLAMLAAACMVLAMVGPSVMAADPTVSTSAEVGESDTTVKSVTQVNFGDSNQGTVLAAGASATRTMIIVMEDLNGEGDITTPAVSVSVTGLSVGLVSEVTPEDPLNSLTKTYQVVVTALSSTVPSASGYSIIVAEEEQTEKIIVPEVTGITASTLLTFPSALPEALATSGDFVVSNVGNMATVTTTVTLPILSGTDDNTDTIDLNDGGIGLTETSPLPDVLAVLGGNTNVYEFTVPNVKADTYSGDITVSATYV